MKNHINALCYKFKEWRIWSSFYNKHLCKPKIMGNHAISSRAFVQNYPSSWRCVIVWIMVKFISWKRHWNSFASVFRHKTMHSYMLLPYLQTLQLALFSYICIIVWDCIYAFLPMHADSLFLYSHSVATLRVGLACIIFAIAVHAAKFC